MVGGTKRLPFAALEFGGGSEEAAQGREVSAGLLFGQIEQVGCVEDGGDGFEYFGIEVQVAFAGFGFTGGFEGGFFFATGLVPSNGAFFPAPFFGTLAGGAGELAAAVSPNAIGSGGCASRAQTEVDSEAGVPFRRFIRLLFPGSGGGFVCHF